MPQKYKIFPFTTYYICKNGGNCTRFKNCSYLCAWQFQRIMKKKEITDNIRDRLGIEELNAMQRKMTSTDARSIILLAPTGSGKTIAFTIAMLRNVEPASVRGEGVGAVILAPSRELVLQIASVVRPVATGLKTVALYGGHPMSDETNSLTPVPDIVIATPGRMLDHINRSTIDISGAKTIVLDEYDKSLELGFLEEMRRIVRRIRRPSLKILTSATRLICLPDFIGRNADFEIIDFGTIAAPRLATTVIEVPSPVRDKIDILVDLLRSLDNQKAIIFVNHRESAERIHSRLFGEGFPVGLYHGGLEQHDRHLAVEMLNNGSTPILVSTDLASRGLDVADVGSVIHYHMPLNEETWIHRNGRTARMGASGTVYVIVSDGEEIPSFIDFDRSFTPGKVSANPIRSDIATLYFNAGRKEKISRGDIAGYLMQKGGLAKEQVGVIVVDDHSAIAAVPADGLDALIARLAPHKLKNKRVKVSGLNVNVKNYPHSKNSRISVKKGQLFFKFFCYRGICWLT